MEGMNMTIWHEVATGIEERGVRVERRLALLDALKAHAEAGGDAQDFVRERHEALVATVAEAARALTRVVRG
jgi:hypothetical protein